MIFYVLINYLISQLKRSFVVVVFFVVSIFLVKSVMNKTEQGAALLINSRSVFLCLRIQGHLTQQLVNQEWKLRGYQNKYKDVLN